jgi:alkylhydroperoxidase family enzyme
MDINAAVGGWHGVGREAIEAALGVRPDAEAALPERERLALEYAGRVSATPVDVPDEFFERLRPLFSEREIVELTAIAAHENYNAKFNRSLRVRANDFCEIPLPPAEEVLARHREAKDLPR